MGNIELTDQVIAEHLWEVCRDKSEDYAIAEIIKRLAAARKEGRQEERALYKKMPVKPLFSAKAWREAGGKPGDRPYVRSDESIACKRCKGQGYLLQAQPGWTQGVPPKCIPCFECGGIRTVDLTQ